MSKVVWSPSKYRAVCLTRFGFPALDLVVLDNFSTPGHNKVIKALSYWPPLMRIANKVMVRLALVGDDELLPLKAY